MKLSVSGQAPGIPYKMKVETTKEVSECVKNFREFLLLVLVLGLAAALEWK